MEAQLTRNYHANDNEVVEPPEALSEVTHDITFQGQVRGPDSPAGHQNMVD